MKVKIIKNDSGNKIYDNLIGKSFEVLKILKEGYYSLEGKIDSDKYDSFLYPIDCCEKTKFGLNKE